MHSSFTPSEHANFLAGKAVAHATAYLDGRHDATLLACNARSVNIELAGAPEDPRAKPVLDAARLLVVAMMGAAGAAETARLDRWQHVMGALVELVRHEGKQLRQNNIPSALVEGSMA